MAILGGAGNPVGGSFTGPAEALEIIGDHAYAYSGKISSDANNFVTLLKFTTGNFYTVGQWSGDYNSNASDDCVYKMEMNGTLVMAYFVNGGAVAPSNRDPLPIIIPPYTEVEVFAKNSTNSEVVFWQGRITGSIYRTRD